VKGGLDKSSPYIRKTPSLEEKSAQINQIQTGYLYIQKGGLDESSPYIRIHPDESKPDIRKIKNRSVY
jgi:hypothetical protein